MQVVQHAPLALAALRVVVALLLGPPRRRGEPLRPALREGGRQIRCLLQEQLRPKGTVIGNMVLSYVQRSAEVDAPGCVKPAGKLRQKP